MDINKYKEDYDFNSYIEKVKEEFKQRSNIQKYLENNLEENFEKFSLEFWENPNVAVDTLKEKYNIPRQVAFSDIIKAYPTNKYIKLLKMYHNNTTIENLISEFSISFNRLEKIMLPIVIDNLEKYCPICFNNSFELENNIGRTDRSFLLECQQCNTVINELDLLTNEEVQQKIKINELNKKEFNEKLDKFNKKLNEIKCPKCQEKLYLKGDNTTFTYEIKCSKCNYNSIDIADTIKEFDEWKQRSAMMIAIKAKEQELIEKALERKKEKDILFTKENIIISSENENTINFLYYLLEEDNIVVWHELFNRIKACNRLEKILLSEVIQLVKEEGEKDTFSIGEKDIILYKYINKEPIIYNLMSRTGILVIRQIIRNLMKRNLIILSEEQNYILIPEILINNLESINNLLVGTDINPNIRYLVLQRQNFTCMACGETGRPLKIAYMTSDKNINNLNTIIALCDNCYDVMTKNEILIDGSITFEVDYLDKETLKSLEFLIQYFPSLENEEYVKTTLRSWEEEYDVNDVIKALTITIDRIEKNDVQGTIKSLLTYTNGILNKSAKKGTGVYIYDSLKREHHLDKWIDDIEFKKI